MFCPWLTKFRKLTQRNCNRACANYGGFFDVAKLQGQLAELEARMTAPDFWSNRERAQTDVEEVSRLRSLINPFAELEREVADFEALHQLAAEETDATARARRKRNYAVNTRG